MGATIRRHGEGEFQKVEVYTINPLALSNDEIYGCFESNEWRDGILARVMRSALLDVLGEDFMRTARAKGLTARQALWRHGLRNALIPVLTIIGLQFSFLLAGSIIIEQVFYLPGLGRLVFQSISARDLIVVESVVMLLVFSVILVNFLVDLAYAAVDPRLRART